MKTGREAAFKVLLKIEKSKTYSDLALKDYFKDSALPANEKALSFGIVLGVLDRRFTLDYILSKYLTKPLMKLDTRVLTLLRMGAYQILFMDRIPDFAAINETVKLASVSGLSFAKGLVNAVLRKVALREPLDISKDEDPIKFYSISCSYPEWLVKHFIDSYGEENAEGIMKASLQPGETVCCANPLKTNRDELLKALTEKGIEAVPDSRLDDAFYIKGAVNLSELSEFNDGLFHVQDISSQLCALSTGAKEGETVIDVCAAPGGKSIRIAQLMNNKGRIISCDIHPHKLNIIESYAKRMGVDIITVLERDATDRNLVIDGESFQGKADRVLCDVPCSGLGVIRGKPEIKYKSEDEIRELPKIQSAILKASAGLVNKGGTLVYSTCTLNPAENEQVCEKFLAENSDFEAIRPLEGALKGEIEHTMNFLTLLPHIYNTDGFFIAAFRRK